jgi:hypothetical protein
MLNTIFTMMMARHTRPTATMAKNALKEDMLKMMLSSGTRSASETIARARR